MQAMYPVLINKNISWFPGSLRMDPKFYSLILKAGISSRRKGKPSKENRCFQRYNFDKQLHFEVLNSLRMDVKCRGKDLWFLRSCKCATGVARGSRITWDSGRVRYAKTEDGGHCGYSVINLGNCISTVGAGAHDAN